VREKFVLPLRHDKETAALWGQRGGFFVARLGNPVLTPGWLEKDGRAAWSVIQTVPSYNCATARAQLP